jgi:putative PIN family toxin of toxin-antitoxin system
MSTGRGVVVDTNVVVSGLLTHEGTAPTAQILKSMLAGRFVFLLSIELLAEYREVLLRPRVRRRHGLDDDDVDAVLARLAQHGAVRQPVGTAERAPDRGDQHLWALLAAAPGAVLVTGNQELIANPPRGVTVLEPAEFVEGWGG